VFKFKRRAWAPHASRPLSVTMALAGILTASTVAAGPAHAATTQYKLTLSTTLDTQYHAINNNGDIIGDGPQPGLSFLTPFLLRAASSTPLTLNVPADQAGSAFATVEAINDSDAVVGESDNGNFTALEWPNRSTPINLQSLPALTNRFFQTQATSINDNGLIVGYGEGPGTHGDTTIAFTVHGSTVAFLPELPTGSDAHAIAVNGTGTTIVGDADTSTQSGVAVEWVNGAIKALPFLPASTDLAKALAVNNSGQAVGADVLNSDRNAHAVLWANGTATDLHFGTTGDAEATSINAGGVIVGDGGGHAFLHQNGTTTDLNTLIPAGSGVTLTTAASINDHGVIVGTATNAHGLDIGFKLTPVN
jgi:probable HAF family extracellular repeat protein